MRNLLLNVGLAVLWLLLSERPSVATFLVGFVLGMLLLALFERVLPKELYLRRVAGLIRFVLVFAREFVLSNVDLLRVVLFRSREDLHPNLITVDVSDLRPAEILLLSFCISLTPGTVTVQVGADFRVLTIHALDGPDPDQVRRQINSTFRNAILGFSRA